MAEKAQINPRISPVVKVQIEQAAKDRACTIGELVETAVKAFLAGGGGDERDDAQSESSLRHVMSVQSQQMLLAKVMKLEQVMAEGLRNVEDAQNKSLDILLALLDYAKTQGIAKEAPLPVATDEELYGPITPDPYPWQLEKGADIAASPPQLKGWRRWFFRQQEAAD